MTGYDIDRANRLEEGATALGAIAIILYMLALCILATEINNAAQSVSNTHLGYIVATVGVAIVATCLIRRRRELLREAELIRCSGE